MRPDRVLLGRVAGVHGLDGGLKIDPVSDRWREWPASLTRVGVDGLGDVALAVRAVRIAAGRPVLLLATVTTRTAAEALVGAAVWRPSEDLPALGDDQFWWHQLVGLLVKDETGTTVGRVEAVEPGPAHDWLRVSAGPRAFWVPFVAAWVVVRLEEGEVHLKRAMEML